MTTGRLDYTSTAVFEWLGSHPSGASPLPPDVISFSSFSRTYSFLPKSCVTTGVLLLFIGDLRSVVGGIVTLIGRKML